MEVVNLLNREINAVLADCKIKSRFAELGAAFRRIAGAVWKISYRRNREVGQGGQSIGREAGLAENFDRGSLP